MRRISRLPFASIRSCIFLVVFAGLLVAVPRAEPSPQTPLPAGEGSNGIDFFERKIRPVLVKECYSCHSAEAKKRKGGLLVDTKQGLLEGGDIGPAVVPGFPEKSLLIKAIRYTDTELKMPKQGRLS